jgi:hypothetical protein
MLHTHTVHQQVPYSVDLVMNDTKYAAQTGPHNLVHLNERDNGASKQELHGSASPTR